MFPFTWSALNVLGGPWFSALPPKIAIVFASRTVAEGMMNWPLGSLACRMFKATGFTCAAVMPAIEARVAALRSLERQPLAGIAGIVAVAATAGFWQGTLSKVVEPLVESDTL